MCVYTHVWERENDLHVDSEWQCCSHCLHLLPPFSYSFCSVALVAQLCPTLSTPMDYSMPGSSVHGILQAKLLEWVLLPSPGIFWTQGLNLGLPHCRQILYHLSHQGRKHFWFGENQKQFEWSSGFPHFLQLETEFGNKVFMIWAIVSSQSSFCWLYRASPSLAAKNIISLILVLTIWWCPCVESSLVLLEEGICYDQCILLAKLC